MNKLNVVDIFIKSLTSECRKTQQKQNKKMRWTTLIFVVDIFTSVRNTLSPHISIISIYKSILTLLLGGWAFITSSFLCVKVIKSSCAPLGKNTGCAGKKWKSASETLPRKTVLARWLKRVTSLHFYKRGLHLKLHIIDPTGPTPAVIIRVKLHISDMNHFIIHCIWWHMLYV